MKESEKYGKYQDLDIYQELKMLWNMRLTMIPIKYGTLGTVPSKLEKKKCELQCERRHGGKVGDHIRE